MDGIKAFFKLVFNEDLSDADVRDIVSSARRWAEGEQHITAAANGQLKSLPLFSVRSDRSNIETAMRRMGRFVDAYLAGDVKDNDTQLLGQTPTVLQALGAENLQMQIDGETIKKIIDAKHRHTMTADDVRKLPEGLHDPVMVFDSPDTRTGAPGKLLVTESSDKLANPIVALVHLSKRGQRMLVNDIASAYGLEDLLSREKTSPARLEYVRNKEALAASTTPNLRMLAGVVQKAEGLGVTVITEADVVKSHGPLFSKGKAKSEGSHTAAVRAVVEKFQQHFKGTEALDIRVVGSVADIPARYRPSPYAEGVFHDDVGLIYLIANQLDGNRAFQVLMHEAVGHYGLSRMMGERFQSLLKHVLRVASAPHVTEDIYGPGDPEYATVEAVRLRYPEASDIEIAQEVLARMAETGSSKLGLFRATIRQWLRDMARALGFELDVTTAELNDLIQQASAYMRKGENLETDSDPSGLVAASRAKEGITNTPAFKRWFGEIFRKAFAAAGLPYFNPHSLRKTLVRLGEERCRTPEQFKAWSQNLGHEQVLTTFLSYGTVPAERQKELVSRLGETGAEVSQQEINSLVLKMAACLPLLP